LIPKDALAGPVELRADLSRVINDHLVDLTKQYPHAFSAYADIPLTPRDVLPAIKELERIHGTGGLVGALIQTNYEGAYLDDVRFAPFFERAHELDVKLFLHPTLPYGLDPLLDYHLYMIVGFPYDTTLTVARMVYSGFFARYPNLKVITSHCGGTIPFLWWRLGLGYRENRHGCRDHLDRDPEYYLKRLYYDTALSDTSQLMETYQRVGDRIVLGTDYPFENEGTSRTLRAIASMDVDEETKNGILFGTLKKVLGPPNQR
jgi:aminocarboxymuconate-semialdehyde decarboxylase